MESVDAIISLFEPFFNQSATPIDELFPEPTFPRIDVHLLNDLFILSKETLKKNKALLEISSPMIVVGDLHGNLMDFIKILYLFGTPPKSRYIFLGDFVDRGRYSVIVISLILSLMVKYPDDVYLIRGNHEFSHINRAYGFFDECMNTYGSEQVWNQFQEVFSYLPLAAVISNSVFCVHGGLSPLLKTIDSIRDLPLPIPNYFNNTMISDLVWSDPVDTVRGFQLNHRGSGQIFGPDIVENFLRANKLKIMIRGHQCTLAGFKPFASYMGITVFSSSNYCSSIANKCGVVAIKDREVMFYNIDESELDPSPSATMCLPIDGDVGLKRIFRTISRPDFHKEISPTVQSPLQGRIQADEEEEEEDEDDFSFQLRNPQSNPFNYSQQKQYNSIMQMRVNMILNQQQLNNSILQKNVPSIPTQINQNVQPTNNESEKEEEEDEEDEEDNKEQNPEVKNEEKPEQNQQPEEENKEQTQQEEQKTDEAQKEEEKQEQQKQEEEQKLGEQKAEEGEQNQQPQEEQKAEVEEQKTEVEEQTQPQGEQKAEEAKPQQEGEEQQQPQGEPKAEVEEQQQLQQEQKAEVEEQKQPQEEQKAEEEAKPQQEGEEQQPPQQQEQKPDEEQPKSEEGQQKPAEEEKQEQQKQEEEQKAAEEKQQQQQQQTEEEQQKQEEKIEEEEQKDKQQQSDDHQDDHHDEQPEAESSQQQPTNGQEQPHQEELQNDQKPEEDEKQPENQNSQDQQQQQEQRQEQQENKAEKDELPTPDQQNAPRTPNSKHVRLAIPVPNKGPGSPSSINVTFGNEPRTTHQNFLQRSRSVIDSLGGV